MSRYCSLIYPCKCNCVLFCNMLVWKRVKSYLVASHENCLNKEEVYWDAWRNNKNFLKMHSHYIYIRKVSSQDNSLLVSGTRTVSQDTFTFAIREISSQNTFLIGIRKVSSQDTITFGIREINFWRISEILNQVMPLFSDLHIVALGKPCEENNWRSWNCIYGMSIKNKRTRVFFLFRRACICRVMPLFGLVHCGHWETLWTKYLKNYMS